MFGGEFHQNGRRRANAGESMRGTRRNMAAVQGVEDLELIPDLQLHSTLDAEESLVFDWVVVETTAPPRQHIQHLPAVERGVGYPDLPAPGFRDRLILSQAFPA